MLDFSAGLEASTTVVPAEAGGTTAGVGAGVTVVGRGGSGAASSLRELGAGGGGIAAVF